MLPRPATGSAGETTARAFCRRDRGGARRLLPAIPVLIMAFEERRGCCTVDRHAPVELVGEGRRCHLPGRRSAGDEGEEEGDALSHAFPLTR